MKAWLQIVGFAVGFFSLCQGYAVDFNIKESHKVTYEVSEGMAKSKNRPQVVEGHRKGSTNVVEFHNQIFVQVYSSRDLETVVLQSRLPVVRRFNETAVLLQAQDALGALRICDELGKLSIVKAAHTVTRKPKSLFSAYAPAPNDPYFQYQWHLEQRNTNGTPVGADVNVRSAWAITKGEGVIVGIADDGIEATHPDLVSALTDTPNYNFADGTTDAGPSSNQDEHATAVAGLVAAEGDNHIGISGVAPRAKLANWKIFDAGSFVMTDSDLFDLYQFHSDIVGVQNHSWGESTVSLAPLTSLEQLGLLNAVTYGRDGKGVVLVRAAGNNRLNGGDANFDGNPSSPYVIAVGAVRQDGVFSSFSNPGACILLGAPGGDLQSGTLFTTDRQGTAGYNFANYTNDFADYAFDGSGFIGTSGSSPIVAGIAALLLSANTNLTYRDVQQILLLSARQLDLTDSDISTNAAGLKVSHNVGFGIPDAGVAVRLAQRWQTRPAATNVQYTTNVSMEIPDDGLKVAIVGVPTGPITFGSTPSLGIPIDQSSAVVPLVDLGRALTVPGDLHGKAALIQRSGNTFREKIDNAAKGGASFAIIYNHVAGDVRLNMGDTEHTTIPAVFLSQNDGEMLQQYLTTNGNANVQLQMNSAATGFTVPDTLLVEHVGVRVQSSHTNNSQLRITLTSPQGTRSVLQRLSFNGDPLDDWTYYSTHHFYESSAGVWTVAVTDEVPGSTGTVSNVELKIEGVPIKDVDGNGLDDDWEMAQFGMLGNNPAADPDLDGYSNAVEQILHTQAKQFDLPLKIDLSRWNTNYARISFPSSTNFTYEVRSGNSPSSLITTTNIPGLFPETEYFSPLPNSSQRFFEVHSVPRH